ncbi:hypothetical protein [Nocardioides coralli]|uniref:hypothetical protein n=1 Tax=Nocardioides coralli TaxID=2872154 RepID=UPI001CA3E103|nr:hypothetical protein [Nocardioides coralli]QZY29829.1 hypothetical protein K6T13_03840 [Nocardioides coralli]
MPRGPLAVAVAGALLVGGAATGTTLASWVDSAQLAGTAVSSGTISLTVDGTTTATFASLPALSLNVGGTPGAAQSFTATLRNDSVGKNLRMRMYVDDVTTGQADLNGGLEISVAGAAPAAACPAPAWQNLSATNNTEVTGAPLAPGGTRKLCVSLRVRAGAPAATASRTGTLTFAFRGAQVSS